MRQPAEQRRNAGRRRSRPHSKRRAPRRWGRMRMGLPRQADRTGAGSKLGRSCALSGFSEATGRYSFGMDDCQVRIGPWPTISVTGGERHGPDPGGEQHGDASVDRHGGRSKSERDTDETAGLRIRSGSTAGARRRTSTVTEGTEARRARHASVHATTIGRSRRTTSPGARQRHVDCAPARACPHAAGMPVLNVQEPVDRRLPRAGKRTARARIRGGRP